MPILLDSNVTSCVVALFHYFRQILYLTSKKYTQYANILPNFRVLHKLKGRNKIVSGVGKTDAMKSFYNGGSKFVYVRVDTWNFQRRVNPGSYGTLCQ